MRGSLQLAALVAAALMLPTQPTQAQSSPTFRVLDAQGVIDNWPASVAPLTALDAPGVMLAQRTDTLELGLVQRGRPWQSLGQRGNVEDPRRRGYPLQLEAKGEEPTPLLWRNGTWSTRHYKSSISALDGDLFVAERGEGDRYDVLHTSGKTLISDIPRETASRLRSLGNNVLLTRGDMLWIHALHDKPRRILPIVYALVREDAHFILYNTQEKVMAIAPLSGHGLRTNPKWRQTAKAITRKDRLWLLDSQNDVLSILTETGQDLLTPAVRQRLGQWHLQSPAEREIEREEATPIVAIVVPEVCPCNTDVHGVLLNNGQLLANPQWSNVRWLGSAEPSRGAPATSSARFAVEIDGAWAMVDARGRVLTPDTYDVMQPMQYGWSVASKQGQFLLLDAGGGKRSLPEFLEVRPLSNGLLAYQAIGSPSLLWGLYDIQRQAIVTPPTWRNVEGFLQGRAMVTDANGHKGLIDEKGGVVVKPMYRQLYQVSESLWTASTSTDDDARWTLLSASGETMAQNLPRAPEAEAGWVRIPHKRPGLPDETVLYRAKDAHQLTLPGLWGAPEQTGDMLVLSSQSAGNEP